MGASNPNSRYVEEVQAHCLRLRGGGLTLSSVDVDRIRSWRDRGLPLEFALQALDSAHGAWAAAGRSSLARPFPLEAAERFAAELMQVAARRMLSAERSEPGPEGAGVAAPAHPSPSSAPPSEAPEEEAPVPAREASPPPAGPAAEPDSFKPIGGPLQAILETLHQRAARVGLVPAPEPARGPCQRCGGRGYTLANEGLLSVATICSCGDSCERCKGRGILLREEDGYQFADRCPCQSIGLRVAAYNAAQLPSRFASKGFEQFHTDGGPPKIAQQLDKIRRLMIDFADTARPGHTPKGFGLFGRPGTGKTHLLVATLARMSLHRGIDCRYIEISFLFADLRAAISDPQARATVDKIEALAEVDVLAIDELGKGRGSVFEEEVLDELIGRRYNNGKLTLFATNFSKDGSDQGAARDRDGARPELSSRSLKLRVGERVFSRLHEMVDFIELPTAMADHRIPPRPR